MQITNIASKLSRVRWEPLEGAPLVRTVEVPLAIVAFDGAPLFNFATLQQVSLRGNAVTKNQPTSCENAPNDNPNNPLHP